MDMKPAPHPMSGADLRKDRGVDRAAVECRLDAASLEAAAGAAGSSRLGTTPGSPEAPIGRQGSSRLGIEAIRPTVYGCSGSLEEVGHAGLLDDLASVHHGNPVGRLGHHPEVMGDQQNRGAELALQSSIIAKICAWMVTSSAVVGSSAMTSVGWHDNAMAIITRWRMPPLSSCGYCLARLRGSGMRTRSSSSTAQSRAAHESCLDAA